MTESITINTHSSIKIEAGKIIYADPFRLGAAAHDADIILITHPHYDHFSPDDIALASNVQTCFVVPESMADDMVKLGIPAQRVILMRAGEQTDVGGVSIEAVAAYNTLKPFHAKKNGWLGYVVTAGDRRIYIAGDTDATPEAAAVKCSVAMIPVGGTYTMTAKEAAALVNKMKPEAAVPVHYGSIVGSAADGEKFAGLVDPAIKVSLLIK